MRSVTIPPAKAAGGHVLAHAAEPEDVAVVVVSGAWAKPERSEAAVIVIIVVLSGSNGEALDTGGAFDDNDDNETTPTMGEGCAAQGDHEDLAPPALGSCRGVSAVSPHASGMQQQRDPSLSMRTGWGVGPLPRPTISRPASGGRARRSRVGAVRWALIAHVPGRGKGSRGAVIF
jgi:hypothetical protein